MDRVNFQSKPTTNLHNAFIPMRVGEPEKQVGIVRLTMAIKNLLGKTLLRKKIWKRNRERSSRLVVISSIHKVKLTGWKQKIH